MSTLSQQERTERRPPDPEEGYRRLEESYLRALGPLFGDFEVSREEAVQPAAPLITSDIRSVLKALPVSDRTPLNQATG